MRVLVQFPSMDDPPVGVWWIDEDETPSSYYAEQTPAELLARTTLAMKADDCSWDSFFESLADRTPVTVNYEVFDISEDPRSFLERLRRIASR